MIVGGLYSEWDKAHKAIMELQQAGFTEQHIGLILRQNGTHQTTFESTTNSKAPEKAAQAALGGSVLGGLIGFLTATGVVMVPGIGPVIAGGILASTMMEAGMGDAASGLMGSLVGMNIPETTAKHFENQIRSGMILVTVQTENREQEASAILKQTGAQMFPESD